MKKKQTDANKKIEHWIQKYIEASQAGNTKLMKAYEAIIKKLGGNIPKF